MKFVSLFWLIAGLVILPACVASSEASNNAQQDSVDWRSDWAVEEGFSISIDTEGYHFPTAIAFVPNPGSGPKDPLYFVTELKGKVKVVTNDRTVYTFAEGFFQSEFYDERPSGESEFGLAGICLEPKRGYVFATFAYQDANKVLRNNIIRFQSEPEVFSIKPTAQLAFTEVFSHHPSGPSHQIGPCQIKDDLLYVSVGDGFHSPKGSQQIDAMLGKIIRMTLDGKPVPDNPFYQDDDVKKAANYVWAYGLRNPFGLKIVEDQLFVADNGPDTDRFLEIRKGENYLWDGSDRSMTVNAPLVFAPGVAPVQVDYYPKGLSIFPEHYEQNFFVALNGKLSKQKIPGIMTFKYGLKENKILSVPKYFLKSSGQPVVGLGFGPDGLYFVPLIPNEEGRSAVFKITYNPGDEYPFTFLKNENPDDLMFEKGCFGCHRLGDRAKGGTAGPPLDREALVARLEARLNSEAYIQSLKEIDLLESEPQGSYKEARKEVVTAEGLDRLRVWLKYRVQEPRFDNLYSQMPNLDVSEKEATLIADFLLKKEKKASVLGELLPSPLRVRHLAISFVGGFLAAVLLWVLWRLVRGFAAARRRKTA